jgi:hypothetical protein
MKCAMCDEEHEGVMLSPACHPGRPLEVSASEHPQTKEWMLEMRCSKCKKHVAYFAGKRVYPN